MTRPRQFTGAELEEIRVWRKARAQRDPVDIMQEEPEQDTPWSFDPWSFFFGMIVVLVALVLVSLIP